MKNLIKNLNKIAEEPVNPTDPLDATTKLEHALAAIGPSEGGKFTHLQTLLHQLIDHNLRLAHLFALPSMNIDKSLLASAMLQSALGALTHYAATNRPKVSMYGVAAGKTLLPVAFLSEGEGMGYIKVQQRVGSGGNMRLVPIELSSTAVDASLRPLATTRGTAEAAAAKGDIMELGPKQEVKLTTEAMEESLSRIVGSITTTDTTEEKTK